MSKKVLLLPITIFILFSSLNYSKAETSPLYLGDDNVYYACQGKAINPQNDDNSENNDMTFDLESVKILNDTFFSDKNGVYFVGTFNYYCYFYELASADQNTFQILNDIYEKDENSVYYNSFYHGGPAIDKIEGADSATFEVFTEDKDYAMDKNNIYHQGEIIGENETTITDDNLYSSLRGKIILQVELNGEAHYVSPDKQKMYFLSRPIIAFKVMREQGIGIANDDLEKIEIAMDNLSGIDSDGDGLSDMMEDSLGTDKNNTDSDGDGFSDKDELLNGYNPVNSNKLNIDNSFAKNQAGKIFLQVEANGEAWYVNPENNKRYFLGRPNDAFSVMRTLGLGISDGNFEKMVKTNQKIDLGHGFTKDNNNIYLENKIFAGADLESFLVLNRNYVKDENNVYGNNSTNPYDKNFIIITTADSDSFVAINDFSAKDNSNVYFWNTRLATVSDPESFEKITDWYYKDKNYVYQQGEGPGASVLEKITSANPATFQIIDTAYTKDDKNIFYYGVVIKNADIESFQIVDYPYSKDNNYVYIQSKVLEGADSESFSIVKSGHYAKDKNYVYDTEGNTVEGADPETFVSPY